MSFSFNGVGTRAEVIRQVRSHHIEDGGLGHHARELVVQALEAGEQLEHAEAFGGHTLYIVKAFGHSGNGGSTSLSISIEPIWVPAERPKAPAASELAEKPAAEEFRTSV